MAAQRLERRCRRTIRHVHLAIAGTAADQQTRLVGAVLQEAQIAHGAVVHRQLRLFALQLLLQLIVAHQLDRFVIGAGGDEIALRRPRHAVDGALVVFGALEEHRWLVGGVILAAATERNVESYCDVIDDILKPRLPDVRQRWVLAYPERLRIRADRVHLAVRMEFRTSDGLHVLQRGNRHETRPIRVVLRVDLFIFGETKQKCVLAY